MCEDLEITDIKDMLKKTKNKYKNKIAYKIKIAKGQYREITHEEVRHMVDCLGTTLINMGLKNKKIAVIGENRFEWGLAYLSVVCGTGMVVPLDKSLTTNEIFNLIEQSGVEAIFFSGKYEKILKDSISNKIGKLKYLISMDLTKHSNEVYSQSQLVEEGKILIENGNTKFINAQINAKEMSIMLFTSGTTSKSKAVALSHENICSNLMDLSRIMNVSENDRVLSFLPLHHVFECTVGFLFSLYKGMQVNFCDGLKHIVENMNEYKTTYMACVPAIYENIYKNIMKKLEKEGKLKQTNIDIQKYKTATMQEKKEHFKEIHNMLGGSVRLLISGAAALNKEIEEGYRNFGINLVQGYGLTETSPVIGIGSSEFYRLGSIGKCVPSVEARLEKVNSEGVGELVVKGPSIMLGYYKNEIETRKVLKNGWFNTGDLAKIDEDGYIFICGRKKSVIVLQNGKNIYPEEMQNIVNTLEGVKESFVFGKPNIKNENNVKIFVEIVYDKNIFKQVYKVESEDEIYCIIKEKIKEINKTMPRYKSIKGIILTEEPIIKTTTSKIKREEELKKIYATRQFKD